MARARNLKPGFFTNDRLAECDPLARLLFAGLWTIADREGRLEDRPRKIKAELLPYDDCEPELLLGQLAERGFIKRYDAGGTQLIQIVNFRKHQAPHVKEAPSQWPGPGGHDTSTVLVPDENGEKIPSSPFPLPSPSSISPIPRNGAAADFEPTYPRTLGSKWPLAVKGLTNLSPEITEGMAQDILFEVERDVGALSVAQLRAGLQASVLALDRAMKGPKPIGALKPYATKIITERLREVANVRH